MPLSSIYSSNNDVTYDIHAILVYNSIFSFFFCVSKAASRNLYDFLMYNVASHDQHGAVEKQRRKRVTHKPHE